ncbi:hypothetical protein C1H46_018375 [Malus baccata]|uniref:Uncharacterized protein n=1 Tax=Malus baccata TaxID=106549 RepID=A0A540MBB5_MALBA|nr:hypothetical protein C1H46_018375 [Malus baccata]
MWVAVLMVSFLVIYCTRWFYKWRTPGTKGNGVLPPGSMGLPFLGEALSLLIPSYSLDLHPFVRKRIQRYGPIFRTSFIGRRVVVSADPEINSYLFSQEGKLVELWYTDTFNKLLSLEGENRITGPGLIHKYMRSSLRNHLSPEALKEKLPQLEAWIDKTLLHWSTKPSVEIKHAVSAMVLEFTSRFLCGYDVDKAPVDISEKFATLTKGLTSLPLNIPGTAFHKCLKDQEKVITMITNMIKERRAKEAEEEKEEDFLDQAIKDLRTENYLTEDFIVRLLYGFLFASFESIGTVMCLGFKLLAEHPEVMVELAAEHEAILKNRADSDSSLTWEEYKSLTFTPHDRLKMIVRTPPTKKQRAAAPEAETPPPAPGPGPLVIFEDDPPPPSSLPPPDSSSHHLLCTYQCRQMVKSDFIDALSNAEKQASDYQSKLAALNEKFCKVVTCAAESDRKKYLDQFLYVEQELAAAKGREQALQEQLLKELHDSHERLTKQLQSNSELEVKLQNEMNLRMKAESSAALAEEKASVVEGKLRHLSENIEREKKRLNNDFSQLKGESKLSVSRITADLERMECRAHNAEKESELLKKQLDDIKKQLSECVQQKSEVEKKLSSFTFQEVESTENNILVKHLQEELRNFDAEVREARKLKLAHENVELLKEKLLEEKGRRERAEAELSKLQELQLSMKKLENELTTWKLMSKDIPGVSCSEDIPVKFAALQKEVIDSMMKVGEANAALKQLEVALDAAKIDKQNAEIEANLAKEKVDVSKSEVKRIELMFFTLAVAKLILYSPAALSMVTEERDKLRNVLNGLKSAKNDEAGDEAASQTFLQEVESSLAKKEAFIKELECGLCEQKEVNSRQREEIKLLNERLNNEARRMKSLERESDRLRSEIALLESKIGHGDFSAANTKVLRMVNTLAADNEAKQTIEALQTELQKTKEKLQAVEELKSQSGDAGTLVDSYISGKIVQLKEQIATLEKREERYKTVFADRISVFRRACCELFGYKIVMDEHQRPNGIPITRFTLQSIYAQSDDEKLEFEYESGSTNILANDYTSQSEISQQVEIFIRKLNSIPAFTANLTVESFNRRTLT